MPCWYYDKKELRNTPSIQDGIEYDTESRYRKEGARFIIATGTKMDLGCNTMATGVVYFHRFYMFHSFRTFPRYVMACCCLFLAGKVEETPKKCKDIIKIARASLSDQKFASFGEDPKEEVMTLERILLQTIKFDLQVEHPYSYVVRYAKCLKGDRSKLQKMVQMAWTFVNDSLCTTLCLQWEPEVIAVALMYLAGKLSQFEVLDWTGRLAKHCRWWDMYVQDVTMDLLEDICHQVLDLYSQPVGAEHPDSPPLPPRPVPAAGMPLLPPGAILPEPTTPSHIPVKISLPSSKNGQDPEDTLVLPPNTALKPPLTEMPTYHYPAPQIGYPPAFTSTIPAPHLSAPPPPLGAPPPPGGPPPTGYPPTYVAPPPHYTPVVSAPPYYQPPPTGQPPPHRPPYYQQPPP